jgi:hypothetical protein
MIPISFSRHQYRTSSQSFSVWRLMFVLMLGLTLMMGAQAQADTLSASIDRNVISVQETFTLSLRFDGQTSQSPDLTPLQTDFEVLNTQQSNQMRIINGKMDSYTDWRIALAPKKSGVFTIPALAVAGAISQPLSITVEAQSRAPQDASSSVFVEIETDKDGTFVQEQILLTIRLFTAVQLNSVELQPLELSDAVVVPLDEKQYQTNINGRPHAVVETSYAIYPQASGVLTIPSLTYQVTASSGQRDIWSRMYGNRSNNLLRLRTEEKSLQIKTIPTEFINQPWIPAENVNISEHWSSSHENLKVGEPVTRTLTVTTKGLTAGQIPPLILPQIDGITFYPDQAQTDEQKSVEGVTGTRIETFAIVPNRAGKFTLPATAIKWWNTAEQRVEITELAPIVLTVTENPFSQNAPKPDRDPTADTDGTNSSTATSAQRPSPSGISLKETWLIVIAIASVLLAIIFAALYFSARRELAAIHALGREETAQQQQAENTAWNNVKRANASGNLAELRQAVLAWAQVHWQQPNLHSLQAVAQQTHNVELQQQLEKLDQALYRNSAETWDSSELLQQIHASRRQRQKQHREQEGLTPLYKNS